VATLVGADHGHENNHHDMDRQEAAPMLDARAFALATSDVAFFSLPPVRPSRSTRRPNPVRGLIGAIRRELERATEGPGQTVLPRITNYPY
jgi:hypothetical protein